MIEFGRVEPVVEAIHDVKAGALVAAWALDFRHAFRLLGRSPLFTVFAVASLALGIGAAGAIFQLFDAIVLRKLPVPESGQMVVASFGGANGRFNYSMPYPHFEEIRRRNDDSVRYLRHQSIRTGQRDVRAVTRPSPRAPTSAATTTRRFVSHLRWAGFSMPATIVRESKSRCSAIVTGSAVSAAARDVVGAPIALNGTPFTIVGVEPEGFAGTEVGRPYDISVPMRARDRLEEGGPLWNAAFATWIYMMGRMKPGVTVAEAERELKTIFAQVSTAAATSPAQLELRASEPVCGSRAAPAAPRATFVSSTSAGCDCCW